MSQPQFATLWAPDGLKTFYQVDGGSTIWSGKKWVRIVRKIPVGHFPIFRYGNRMNASFTGTKNHLIRQYGGMAPVGQCSYMTSSMWEPYLHIETSEINSLAVSEEHPTWVLELEGSERMYWTNGALALDYRGEMQGR